MSATKVAVVSATAVAVLAALYTAAGYLAVPSAVKWAVGKYLPAALDGKNATVESVSFNPWSLALEIQNLKVESAKHPGTNVLSLGYLKADASISSLFKMAPILEQLSVKSLIVDYDQTPAGAKAKKTVTESSMAQGAAGAAKVAKSESKPKNFSIPALSLADVTLTDSSVRFRDASQGVDLQATEINFQLPLISTLASSTDLPEMTPKLSLKLDGNPISATGKTTKSGATITLNIPELDAARIVKALPVKLPVSVNSLRLSADVTADYSMANGANNVLLSGKVHAGNINVSQNSSLAFTAKSLDVDLGKIDVFGQKAQVASVALSSPDARASLKRLLSLASLDADRTPSVRLASSGFSPIGTAHAAQQAGWDWSVGSVKLSDGKVTVKDDTLKTPAAIALSAINVSATNVTQAPGARTKLAASLNVAKGAVKLDADASLASLAGTAKLVLSSIDLSALSPWIRHYGETSVTSGLLSLNTSLTTAMAGKSPSVKLSGKASLSNLAASYLAIPASVRLGSLSVDIKDVDTAKQTAAIGSVVLTSPSVSVARSSLEKSSEKSAEPQKKSDGKPAPAASKGSEAPAWNWSVASVELKDGTATLNDDTLKPAASLTLSKINVTTQNLSSQKGATSPYSISAAVAQGTIASEGKFSLAPLSVTASNKINGVSLPTFNPWLAASGASMTKGAASLNGALTFKQADKTAVTWKGNMQIDDFSAKKGGTTVLSWQKAMANNVNLKSIDPVDVSIELVEIDQPMQKLMKQEQKVGSIIGGLLGKTKYASKVEKFETKLRQDVKLHNLTYRNGKFSAGKSDNSLSSVLLKGLDSVFGKN